MPLQFKNGVLVGCRGGRRGGGRLGNKEMVGDGGEAVSCENMRKLTLDLTIIYHASRDSVWKYVDLLL